MDISHKLLQQRIRNRIIDNLESFADPDWVNKLGTDEIIEMWHDIMDNNETFEFFSEPVFTRKELNAIKKFHYLLMSSYKHIPTTWQQEELQNNNNWAELVKIAREVLDVFMSRGRFSEDREMT